MKPIEIYHYDSDGQSRKGMIISAVCSVICFGFLGYLYLATIISPMVFVLALSVPVALAVYTSKTFYVLHKKPEIWAIITSDYLEAHGKTKILQIPWDDLLDIRIKVEKLRYGDRPAGIELTLKPLKPEGKPRLFSFAIQHSKYDYNQLLKILTNAWHINTEMQVKSK